MRTIFKSLGNSLFALLLLLGALTSDSFAQSVTPSANLDTLLCNTWGSIAIRKQFRWQCLPPGTAGYYMQSNGAGADPGWSNPAAGGTVSSVGLSAPAIFSVAGSPVTISGTLALTLASQTQNLFWMSPDGSSGAPTFRAPVSADFPASLTFTTPTLATYALITHATVPTARLSATGGAADQKNWEHVGATGSYTFRAANDALGSFTNIWTCTRTSGITVSGCQFGVGQNFGSVLATGVDLSKHIALYSNSFGFNITSGRLNSHVQNGSSIWSVIGGTDTFGAVPGGAQLPAANSYLSFSTPAGSTGYGLRDNAGAMEWKDSAGAWTSFASRGTVSSVALSLPAELSVTGSPITTSGTLGATWATQTTNKVFAAPDGSTGTPTFRTLACADLADGPWCQIATSAPSGVANVTDTTSLTSTYSQYKISLRNVTMNTGSQTLQLRARSGGTIQTTGYVALTANTCPGGQNLNTSTTEIPLIRPTASTASSFMNMEIHISNPADATAVKPFWGSGTYRDVTAGNWCTVTFQGAWEGGVGAITGFQILVSSGTLSAQELAVYGQK